MCYIKTISLYYQLNMSPLISIYHLLKILPGVKYFPKCEQRVLDIIQIAYTKIFRDEGKLYTHLVCEHFNQL
jgi:hypothetical protein